MNSLAGDDVVVVVVTSATSSSSSSIRDSRVEATPESGLSVTEETGDVTPTGVDVDAEVVVVVVLFPGDIVSLLLLLLF